MVKIPRKNEQFVQQTIKVVNYRKRIPGFVWRNQGKTQSKQGIRILNYKTAAPQILPEVYYWNPAAWDQNVGDRQVVFLILQQTVQGMCVFEVVH